MKHQAIVILALAFFILILGAASFFLHPISSVMKKKSVSIGNVAFEAEVADTMMARARGLSGRERLDADKGMLFLFDAPGMQGFWMKDMKFPIDIIWINGDRVAGFSENLEPEPGKSIFSLKVYYPPSPVDKVLEVDAGVVKVSGFKIGDTATFYQIESK